MTLLLCYKTIQTNWKTIFVTEPATFQENINVFFEYSKRWRLNVNLKQTKKILVFGVRNTMNFEFKLGDNKTDICNDYKYIGTVFTKHRTFFKAIEHNVDHAKKALHLLYKRINNLQTRLDPQLHLFDSTVLSVARPEESRRTEKLKVDFQSMSYNRPCPSPDSL